MPEDLLSFRCKLPVSGIHIAGRQRMTMLEPSFVVRPSKLTSLRPVAGDGAEAEWWGCVAWTGDKLIEGFNVRQPDASFGIGLDATAKRVVAAVFSIQCAAAESSLGYERHA